jgi:hypothetical protein
MIALPFAPGSVQFSDTVEKLGQWWRLPKRQVDRLMPSIKAHRRVRAMSHSGVSNTGTAASPCSKRTVS